ncbi:hypothetical protein BHM03_00045254 [Ensete ventricosum]|nr:hypothetical protein BHM03_00045254 [Ensete ventricosum]
MVLSNTNTRELAWTSQDYRGLDLKNKIAFDLPFEILTHVTGYFGTTMLMGPTAVKSLMFHTTKRGYRPYGDELGTFFSSSLVDGMIIGFHGRSGWYIDSVGVHALKEKVHQHAVLPMTQKDAMTRPCHCWIILAGLENQLIQQRRSQKR